ncbi:MAG: CHAT domain-containing protein, partial [Bacteroidota bacterium]
MKMMGEYLAIRSGGFRYRDGIFWFLRSASRWYPKSSPTFALLLLGIAPLGLRAQTPENWPANDLAVYLHIDSMPTFLGAADSLANYLTQTRPPEPQTAYLAELHHKTALWYFYGGDLEQALQWIDVTLPLRETTPGVTLVERARTEYLKGDIFYTLALYPLAAEWFEMARETLAAATTAGEDGQHLFQMFHRRIAETTMHMGDFARAELFIEILKDDLAQTIQRTGDSIAQTKSDRITLAICEGLLSEKQGQFERAEAVYEAIEYDVDELSGLAQQNLIILKGNQAYGNVLAGNYAAAERNVSKLLAYAEGQKKKHGEFSLKVTAQYGFLAMAQQATGAYEALGETLKKGAAAGAMGAPDGKAKQLGTLYTYCALGAAKAGDFRRADSLMAEGLFSLSVDSNQQRLPRISNAVFYGEEEMAEWLAARRDIDRMAFEQGVREDGLDRALQASTKLDTLLRKNWTRLNLNESRELLLQKQRRQVQEALDIALEQYARTKDASYLEQAYGYVANLKASIMKSRLLGPKAAKVANVPKAILREQRQLALSILSVEGLLREGGRADGDRLKDSLIRMDTRLAAIKTDLARTYPAYAQAWENQAPFEVDEVARTLAKKQQLCEFHLTPEAILVFSLRRERGLRIDTLPYPVNLDERIENVLSDSTAAITLYETLIGPVVDKDVNRLLIIPDGRLWLIPFQALRMPGGRYLIEEYAMSYAYAA